MVVLNQMQCSWSALVSLLCFGCLGASVEVPGPGMPVPLASSGILLTLSSVNSSSLAIVKCTEIPDFNSYICLQQNLLLGWNWTGCVLLLYFCPECFCLCMKAGGKLACSTFGGVAWKSPWPLGGHRGTAGSREHHEQVAGLLVRHRGNSLWADWKSGWISQPFCNLSFVQWNTYYFKYLHILVQAAWNRQNIFLLTFSVCPNRSASCKSELVAPQECFSPTCYQHPWSSVSV